MKANSANEPGDPDVEFANRIENSTVNNLIQAGTVDRLYVVGESRLALGTAPEGGYRFDYRGSDSPPDLLKLRLWLDQILAAHRPRPALGTHPAAHRPGDRVRRFGEKLDEAPSWDGAQPQIERLVVLGISSYLARSSPTPPDRLPQQVLLDLLVFGLWPVVTAKRLPEGWESGLSRLTSPRLAALVAQARASRPKHGEAAATRFARAVAAQDFTTPVLMLCESLAGPLSGADLTAIAVVAGLEPVRSAHPKELLKWLLGAAAGAAATGAALHCREAIETFVEDLTDGMPLNDSRNTYRAPGQYGDGPFTDLGSGDGDGDGGGGD